MDSGEKGVKDFFSGYAEEFDSIYGDGSPRSFFNRLMDKSFRYSMYERHKRTLNFLKEKQVTSVLDVGCGSGRYCTDLALLGINVLGVDLSESMISLGKSNAAKNNLSNISYKVGSYLDTATKTKYDASILMGFFDYIEKPTDIFLKLKKDTNKYILASFPKGRGFLAWQRKIRYQLRNCQLFYYSKESIAEIMDECSIKNYEIQDNDREYFLIVNLK